MIPKIINYIHIDEKAQKEGKEHAVLPLYNQLCIASARVSNPDYRIRIYTNLPLVVHKGDILYGKDKMIHNIIIPNTYMNEVNHIGIKKVAHKADFIRYRILDVNGGIYSDTDIIINKLLDDLLDNGLVVAYQSKLQICNGFIMCEPNMIQIYNTIDNYFKDYRGDSWTYNSMKYFQDQLINNSERVLMLPYEKGFHYPHFNHLEEILQFGDKCDQCYAHHLWNSSPQGKLLKKRIEYVIDNGLDDGDYIEKKVVEIINKYKKMMGVIR